MADETDASFLNPEDSEAQHSHTGQDSINVSPEPSVGESHFSDSISPAILQIMKDKGREWEDTKKKGKPLALLDLPIDVLRLIVNEINYTNDLIALALTHSALYKLAVPSIYSRFDIVWPSVLTTPSSSKSVDALSYGLATLCLPNRFSEIAKRSHGVGFGPSKGVRRLTDEYARYIRKFSLGDGPSQWTSEYLITKESGKMLGTLAAIAVSKMINLDTFIWDMPTGVLSDVFMALSSLEDDQGQAKLEKVWVRWHDNSAVSPGSSATSSPLTAHPPQSLPTVPLGVTPASHITSVTNNTSVPKSYAQSRTEYPTFSVLPPLKSLTVLDIDEFSYLDEISVLIERSASQLRELQIGISMRASGIDAFANLWEGAYLQQVDHEATWPGENRISSTRLGGVLGVLVGRIYDIRTTCDQGDTEELSSGQDIDTPAAAKHTNVASETDKVPQLQNTVNNDLPNPFLNRKRLDGNLRLEKLALERVTLSIAVCLRAIDWNTLTSLTLLRCRHHEVFWRALRRQFQPSTATYGSPQDPSTQYHLALKHISTDLVSPAFLSVLKETIAPNTLETIFLLDQGTLKPSVTLEQIFRTAVKRQRNSLKKLLIHSSDKSEFQYDVPIIGAGRSKYWAMNDEFLAFLASGKMPKLRELGMSIRYKDWHLFLQQLPQIANLRSLYIPQLVGSRGPRQPAEKDLILQMVDVVILRREIQLTYVGLGTKCYEITEVDPSDGANNRFPNDTSQAVSVDNDEATDGISDGDETEDDDDDGNNPSPDGEDESAGWASEDDGSEAGSGAAAKKPPPQIRLREILYYDDKVELFRARHGRL